MKSMKYFNHNYHPANKTVNKQQPFTPWEGSWTIRRILLNDQENTWVNEIGLTNYTDGNYGFKKLQMWLIHSIENTFFHPMFSNFRSLYKTKFLTICLHIHTNFFTASLNFLGSK